MGTEPTYSPRYGSGLPEEQGNQFADDDRQTAGKKKRPKAATSQSSKDQDGSSKQARKPKSIRTGDGNDNEPDLSDEEDEGDDIIDYPRLSFKGTGYTTYERKDHLTTTMAISTRMDDYELELFTEQARILCGKKGGCNQGEVDRDVQDGMIGKQVYERTSKADLAAMANRNGSNILIFADSVTDKDGKRFSFTTPIPVYPWPSRMAAYEDQGFRSNSWQTSFSHGGQTHQMVISSDVSRVNSDTVKVTITLDLPGDRDHKLYELLPVMKQASYTINTDTRDIRAFKMTTYFNGDKSRDPEEMVLNHELCEKIKAGKRQTYNCTP